MAYVADATDATDAFGCDDGGSTLRAAKCVLQLLDFVVVDHYAEVVVRVTAKRDVGLDVRALADVEDISLAQCDA